VDRSDKVFIILVLGALLAAGVLASERARIEQANRTVEIVLDADDARQLASAAGMPPTELLRQLRDAGASALAVREITIGELLESGRLLAAAAPGQTRLLIPDAELAVLLQPALRARLPHLRSQITESPFTLLLNLNLEHLAQVPVILRPEDLRAARGTGLRVVARLLNFPAASPQAIEAAVAEAEATGARLVVFDREEVLGYDGLLAETAQAFRQHGLLYGFVEMAGQRGDEALARLLASRVVSVHSISDFDMLTMLPEVAVPRFVRAVRERNVRACYVRLLLRPQRDPTAANRAYVRAIAQALRGQGFKIGPPVPFQGREGWPPKWLRLLVALGLPAAAVLLLRRLIPLTPGRVWVLFLVLAAFGLLLGLVRPGLVVPLGGLLAACVFPTLGLLSVLQAARGTGLRPAHRPGSGWGEAELSRSPATGELVGLALGGLVAASAISVAGGMLIVGLYSRPGYLAGGEYFTGVKLSYLTPLVLVLAAVIADLPGRTEPLAVWWTGLRLRLGQFFSRPILVIEALIVLAALGAVSFALMRSGNQALVAPSQAEIKLRSLLESLLVVRPRTKEFLVGHPALMLALALSLRGRRVWLPLLALLAGIGQVSLVNTFCHLHTPLYISFLRAGHGLWTGALMGVVVILVWRLLFDRPPPATLRSSDTSLRSTSQPSP